MANSNSRLEQLIEDIYEFVDTCKASALSSNKIIVPKDELLDLLDELRLRTPDEIKKYQRIVANKDAIIHDAQSRAAAIVAEAEAKANKLISESEIMGQAYSQANELVRQANEEAAQINEQVKKSADEITSGAFEYTNDILDMADEVLSKAYKEAKVQFEAMLDTLHNSLTVVRDNKKEMQSFTNPGSALDELDKMESLSDEGDFDFDADAFIDNIDQ